MIARLVVVLFMRAVLRLDLAARILDVRNNVVGLRYLQRNQLVLNEGIVDLMTLDDGFTQELLLLSGRTFCTAGLATLYFVIDMVIIYVVFMKIM